MERLITVTLRSTPRSFRFRASGASHQLYVSLTSRITVCIIKHIACVEAGEKMSEALDNDLKIILENKELAPKLVQILLVLSKGPIGIPEDLFVLLDENKLYDFEKLELTLKGKQLIAESSPKNRNKH